MAFATISVEMKTSAAWEAIKSQALTPFADVLRVKATPDRWALDPVRMYMLKPGSGWRRQQS